MEAMRLAVSETEIAGLSMPVRASALMPELIPAPIPMQRSRVAGRAAVQALYRELCLYPKPGLVSKVDTGSHEDMTAQMFVRSLFSLRHYFSAIYLAGANNVPFSELRRLGIEAERRMLRATGGVNTHRGAIFNLGLLCAAAGRCDADGNATANAAERHIALSGIVIDRWAACIKAADSRAADQSNGERACRAYAVGGARGEAAAGFPHVFKVGLPALAMARRAGAGESAACAQAFFAIMASLEDTNLLHRGGAEGLACARDAAASFLADGGVLSAGWRERAAQIHRDFVRRRLSPGGSADLLAATLLVDRFDEGHG